MYLFPLVTDELLLLLIPELSRLPSEAANVNLQSVEQVFRDLHDPLFFLAARFSTWNDTPLGHPQIPSL